MTLHLEGLPADLRFAVRSLRRSPGFGATAIVSLALGVALTASTLSVMNSYLVRAMPFPASDRLYRALYDSPGQPEPRGVERVDWKSFTTSSRSPTTPVWAASSCTPTTTRRRFRRWNAPPGALDAIGVRAALGRGFRPTSSAPAGSTSS